MLACEPYLFPDTVEERKNPPYARIKHCLPPICMGELTALDHLELLLGCFVLLLGCFELLVLEVLLGLYHLELFAQLPAGLLRFLPFAQLASEIDGWGVWLIEVLASDIHHGLHPAEALAGHVASVQQEVGRHHSRNGDQFPFRQSPTVEHVHELTVVYEVTGVGVSEVRNCAP